MGRLSGGRSWGPWVVLAGLLGVPFAGGAAWWALSGAPNPTADAVPVAPIHVPVDYTEIAATTTVSIEVNNHEGVDVVTQATGTVTLAPIAGGSVQSGDVIFAVNDHPIRAMVSEAPLWRSLGTGDTGGDVIRLENYLSSLGYYSGVIDGTFGRDLRSAVHAFNMAGDIDSFVFDPASVIWIGDSEARIAQSLVAVGDMVNPGTPIARGPDYAAGVTVEEPPGGIATAGDFSSGAELVVGDLRAPYQTGSGVIDDADTVQALVDALAPATSTLAQIQAATPLRVAVVPASSLVQGLDGTVCVYATIDSAPVKVVPLGGGVASSQVDASLGLTEVVANPGRFNLSHPCVS